MDWGILTHPEHLGHRRPTSLCWWGIDKVPYDPEVWMPLAKKLYHFAIDLDYSRGTSARAQKGRGLHEEVLKMLNRGTVC